MKKVIRLTESDLARIVKRVIKEQSSVSNTSNSSVIAIYNEIVDASEGFGTDPDKILSAIKKLKNQNEFKYLLTLFKDKKTGWSNFFLMIDKEYESDNGEDVELLISALKNINVFTTASFGTNGYGSKMFKGAFRLEGSGYYNETPKTTQMMQSCKSSWTKSLPAAIKWWRDWLSDPITKKKFMSNYPNEPYITSRYYPEYFELLNKIKLHFYNDNTISVNNHANGPQFRKAIAYVVKPDGNIYVNCSLSSSYEEEIDEILTHEIQHMIYDIKPLNPADKISSSFGKINSEKKSKEQIKREFLAEPLNKTKTKEYSPEIIAVAKKYNLNPWYLSNLQDRTRDNRNPSDPGYICRATEKMSNIVAVRKALGIKPGQNITFDMIKPYITKQKTNNDVSFILFCWTERGFTDLNQMLQNINQLALKQNKQSQQNNTPPVNPIA